MFREFAYKWTLLTILVSLIVIGTGVFLIFRTGSILGIVIYLTAWAHPAAIVHETAYGKKIERREKQDIQDKRLFTIISRDEGDIVSGKHTLNAIIGVMVVNAGICLFRFAYPETVSVNEAFFSAVILGWSIYIYRKSENG